MASSAMTSMSGRVVLLVAAVITLFSDVALGALFSRDSPVVQLSTSNFKRHVLDIEKPTLVAFTAPWCGHCQRLVPEFERASRSLDGIVKFANLDCDEEANKATCARYSIQGFPTIKLFPATTKRLPRDYRGERNAKSLVEYAVDSLPRSVTKVNAEDIKGFVVEKDPETPKVVLFSNKPTSSPLYKSLALDFRKSMVFAIARGDQPPVQNAARVHLGVNFKGEKDLPVLVAFGPRGEEAAFDKGSFETYEGKLKYDVLKKWLDGLKEKWGVKDTAAGVGDGKKGPAKKTKAKPKTKAKKDPSSDSSDEALPAGGSYEWKPPPSRQQGADAGPMLSKERASKLAEDIKAKQDSLHKKQKGEHGDAKKMAFGAEDEDEVEDGPGPAEVQQGTETKVVGGEGREHKVQMVFGEEQTKQKQPIKETKVDPNDPYADPDAFPDHVNEGPYIYTDGQQADVHAMNRILEESGAYGAAEEALNRVGDAAKVAREGATDAMNNVKKAAESIAEKLGSAGTASKEYEGSGEGMDPDRQPFIAKRRALLSTFERWLAGEHPDWQEQYGAEFMQATKDVEHLLATDPMRAEELAWENEEWMLAELKADREKMADVLGMGKRENLEEMISLIEERLKGRGEEEGRRKREEGIEAAVEAVLRREERERGMKEGEAKKKTAEHDEL